MRPLYRYYYVAFGLVLISFITHLIEARVTLTPDWPEWFIAPWFQLLAFHLPLAISLTIGLFVTWRYWSWLVTERSG